MKVYQLHRSQFLPVGIEEAWDFFSSPSNLGKITPQHMGFKLLYPSDEAMHAGQIIHYRIRILPFFTVTWTTEITHVSAPYYFVDEQRSGPYKFWHHQHHLREVKGGVEMIDKVNYSINLGCMGRLVNRAFVRHELNAIFDFRRKALEELFPSEEKKQIIRLT